MTTNEFYYLLLVLGAFGIFAVGLGIARLRYVAWLGRTTGNRSVTAAPDRAPVGLAPAE
jgi:hypothetical protein